MIIWSSSIGWLSGLELSIAFTCLIGDAFTGSGGLNLHLKAASDSATHGLIAMLSWLVVRYTDFGWLTMLEALACGLLSMAFDMDHFVAAKSWNLKNAVSLTQRPALHNSSLIVFLTLSLLAISEVLKGAPTDAVGNVAKPFSIMTSLTQWLPWIFCVAGTSHHVRDATRRGFLFLPFGSTAPLPYAVYVLLTMFLPIAIRLSRAKYLDVSNSNDSSAYGSPATNDVV